VYKEVWTPVSGKEFAVKKVFLDFSKVTACIVDFVENCLTMELEVLFCYG